MTKSFPMTQVGDVGIRPSSVSGANGDTEDQLSSGELFSLCGERLLYLHDQFGSAEL